MLSFRTIRNLISGERINEVAYARKILDLINKQDYRAINELLKKLGAKKRRNRDFDINKVFNYVDESNPKQPTLMAALFKSLDAMPQDLIYVKPYENAFAVAQQLIELGFPVDKPLYAANNVVPNLTMLGWAIKITIDKPYTTPYCIAFAESLLANNAKVNETFVVAAVADTGSVPQKMSPIQYAIFYANSTPAVWVEFLLRNNAEVDNNRIMHSDRSLSTLEMAANSTYNDVTEMLLKTIQTIPDDAAKARINVAKVQLLLTREIASRILKEGHHSAVANINADLCRSLLFPETAVPLFKCCVAINANGEETSVIDIFKNMLTAIETSTPEGEQYKKNIVLSYNLQKEKADLLRRQAVSDGSSDAASSSGRTSSSLNRL